MVWGVRMPKRRVPETSSSLLDKKKLRMISQHGSEMPVGVMR